MAKLVLIKKGEWENENSNIAPIMLGCNSAGECVLHTDEVVGSIPITPTILKSKICPPELAWAKPLIEHQKTAAFKNFIGYYKAVARQRTKRKTETRLKPCFSVV